MGRCDRCETPESVDGFLLSFRDTVARQACQERLDAVASDRIMWGAHTVNAEKIDADIEFTQQCRAEALTEKVQRGELLEQHAQRIGRQMMRDNGRKLFPH
jgi:hypothetical protein